MDDVNIDSVENKKSTILTIVGIIFLVIGAVLGGFCFTQVINALVTHNNVGLALLILILIMYGIAGVAISTISVVLNVLAYKSSSKQKVFKLIVMIVSILVLVMSIASFVIWFIEVKVQ